MEIEHLRTHIPKLGELSIWGNKGKYAVNYKTCNEVKATIEINKIFLKLPPPFLLMFQEGLRILPEEHFISATSRSI